MKDYICERVLEIANYVVQNRCTVRHAGKVFCVSKSTVHKDLHHRLLELDKALFDKVQAVLDDNWSERYIRGGQSTKHKYLQNNL